MSYDRGDVVVASDPFKDDESAGRPFLVINRSEMPFHGEQYVVLSLTTRTWHDERIPLEDDHWVDGGAPESSSLLPWSAMTLQTDWIAYRQGRLGDSLVDRAVAQLVSYIE